MGNIIGTIIFGAVIGVLARFFKKGDEGIGVLWTVLLGIVGVVVGNLLLSAFGYPANTPGIDWIRWVVCTIAAMLAIGVYLGVTGRKN
ncbi:GlsB/YeaQ/YmgE family stress response membrane protein [Arcanobacterium canis]